MATTIKKVLTNLRDDPETGLRTREELAYSLTLPAGYDAKRAYGVVFCVAGFGDTADAPYHTNILRPYIADKYDLIAVGVRYHNDARTDGRYDINLVDIGRYLGQGEELAKSQANWDSLVNTLFALMSVSKVYRLPLYLAPKTGAFHRYSSFGFLPALDHLDVLHDLSQQFRIDKQQIIAIGAGYGGYIASLLGKYAPFTFSLIVDVSGYCTVELGEVFGGAVGRAGLGLGRDIDGSKYVIPIISDTIWSFDDTSEFYFSDAHRQIRNLLHQGHRVPSPTVHCHYHSVSDGVTPIKVKDQLCGVLDKYYPLYYQRIQQTEGNGEAFRDLSQGGAVLEKYFDLSMEQYQKLAGKKENDFDFDRDVTYGFPCSDKLYNFIYTGKGLEVQISPVYL